MRQTAFTFVLALLLMSCGTTKYTNVDELEQIDAIRLEEKQVPLFAGTDNNEPACLVITGDSTLSPVELAEISLQFTDDSDLSALASLSLVNQGEVVQTITDFNSPVVFKGPFSATAGKQVFSFRFGLKADANLLSTIQLENVDVKLATGERLQAASDAPLSYRFAQILRAAGQDNCDTYRIPGLITTNQGSLIAVYDNRYNNSKDLQEDINIGMSRSTDGGQTWEPMKVIMDMGEWGGQPEELNGVGDPCVLYDPVNSTIWVAALWLNGFSKDQMAWWVSKPGLSPQETGQFLLTKSTDDGLTWSEPINITEQIKDPAWQLLLQGPGRGIAMEDGTLVFPAQFKADIGEKSLDGGQYTSHSTLVYSKDAGQSWHIGVGAKSNTTEAQVVELADGSLMLNMRDDRNRKDKSETNGRAVAVTKDFGQSWEVHPSSNSALPESNCMASIISAELSIDGAPKRVLFFSNPNNINQRTNMTIKASLDEGMSWPAEYQLQLNEAGGYGYSCMTMIDENTIGILYEGVKELYFQKIPVAAILGK